MKRIVLLLSLAVFCIAAVCYAVPYCRRAQEVRLRHDAYSRMLASSQPLVLDAATQTVLAGADRVETFRLADFHEGEDYTPEEQNFLSSTHAQLIDDYTVLHVGRPQGRAFAAGLRAALAETPSPMRRDGLMTGVPSCFDPGVAFRVWKGKARVDICVCFYCTGIQIFTAEAGHKISSPTMTILGASRPAFLALSKQAFPLDKRLSALE